VKTQVYFIFTKTDTRAEVFGCPRKGKSYTCTHTHTMPPFWCTTAAKRCARRQTCSTLTWKRQFEVHLYMWIFFQTTWCAVNVHASISSCHLKIVMQAVPISSLYLFSCRMLKGNLLWNPVRAMLYVCRCEVSPFCHRFFIWLIFLSSCRSHTT